MYHWMSMALALKTLDLLQWGSSPETHPILFLKHYGVTTVHYKTLS